MLTIGLVHRLDVSVADRAQKIDHAFHVGGHGGALARATHEIESRVGVERYVLVDHHAVDLRREPERGREDANLAEHALVLDARVEAHQTAE